MNQIAGGVPDATTLQSNFESKVGVQPADVIQTIMNPVDSCFPVSLYQNEVISDVRIRPPEATGDFISDIPLRVIAALLVTGFACEEINRGDYWCYEHSGIDPKKSTRASVYMSAVYYFIRRHTNASSKQARMSLRT